MEFFAHLPLRFSAYAQTVMHLVAPFLCPSPISTLLLKSLVRSVAVFTGEAALVLGSFLSAFFSGLNSSLPSALSDVSENVCFFLAKCVFYLVLLMGR